MQLIELQQGTPEWAAHRANYFNASEAAIMLGVSPYMTRDDARSKRISAADI